jgi:hypothetical protein
MPIVALSDGRELEFPEGMSQDQMKGAIDNLLQKEATKSTTEQLEVESLNKEQKRQKALENIKKEKRALEVESFGVKNIARDVAGMTPLVGGFVDNAEAFLRSRQSGKDYNDELAKVRENQRNYAKLVKEQTGNARVVGNVIGGFGAGLALPPLVKGGKVVRIAGAGVEGAIEAAGFGDERAKESGIAGGLISAGISAILGSTPTRQLNEVAESTGDVRKLASDNKTTNLLVKGIDASKRIANNIKEVVDVALSKNKEDVSNVITKGFGEDVVNIKGVTDEANRVFGEYIKKFGKQVLPIAGENATDQIDNLVKDLKLTPTGKKVLTKSILEAADDTGEGVMTLNTLQTAKKKLDDLINFNVKEKTTSGNFVLKRTKNKLNNLLKDSFEGFGDVQSQRKVAFDVSNAFEEGFNFSPSSKKSLLKIVDDTGRERIFKNWTKPEQQAFKQGVKANLVNKILSTTETTNIANSLSKNRRLIIETLGKKEGDKLIKELISESNIFKNLVSLSSKSRNRLQDRGSLNRLLSGNLTLRNVGLPGAAAFAGGPAVGAGVLGAQIAGKTVSNLASARTAGLALRGVQPKQFTDLATALQFARGTGKLLREE